MTALEVLVKNRVFLTEDVNQHFNLDVTRDCYVKTQKDIVKSMNEYARIKCKELLEIAAKKAKINFSNNKSNDFGIDVDSILNSVDLEEFIK